MQANGDSPNHSIQRSLLDVNLFRGTGKGVASIFESKLPQGMYLVHCDLSEMLSHSMALHVKGPRRSHQVYDDGNWLGVMETVEWLYRARSIYRIEFITDDQPTLKPARKN
ncbi:hypothetical protein PHYPSEUDO_005817 [Phytophthora pseudosyringae]|uniref:Uncharacterized protein n=1 Tax=Phytophthora pseudosyringae TaxID=221518 RepID=A0A8T1VJY2_9STRA|nr:hypothetical protein PHYPSEUDO_005817 [Phytophthora pseudosyringae]